jgi:methionyl aminopeptidase
MSIDSSADWDGLRAVSLVASQTLDLLTRALEPGITTRDLDRMAAAHFASCGAVSAPAKVYGFPGSVLISINDEIVHGVPGARRIQPGDLVSLDVTVELAGYVADAARSVVVGAGDEVAARLVGCARAAFEAALGVATTGTRVNEIGRAVEGVVRQQGFSVVRGLAGHGVGRTIHEPPCILNEWDPRQADVLTEGLVITIEPMVAAGSGRAVEGRDGWTIRTRDGSLAAHHEDTLVITRGRPLVLTEAAGRS